MTLIDALRELEKSPAGAIKRTGAPVGIFWYDGDSWADMKKCRVTLTIADLLTDDWALVVEGLPS